MSAKEREREMFFFVGFVFVCVFVFLVVFVFVVVFVVDDVDGMAHE